MAGGRDSEVEHHRFAGTTELVFTLVLSVTLVWLALEAEAGEVEFWEYDSVSSAGESKLLISMSEAVNGEVPRVI